MFLSTLFIPIYNPYTCRAMALVSNACRAMALAPRRPYCGNRTLPQYDLPQLCGITGKDEALTTPEIAVCSRYPVTAARSQGGRCH